MAQAEKTTPVTKKDEDDFEETPALAREVFTVRNLARDPSSRTARKLRPGNYTGFLLGDGRRIRRQGARGVELSFKDAYLNRDAIIEGVRNKEIEVSLNGEVGSAAMIESFMRSYESHKGHLKKELSIKEKKQIEKESGLGDDNPSQLPTAGASGDALKLAAEEKANAEALVQAKLDKEKAEEELRNEAERVRAESEKVAASQAAHQASQAPPPPTPQSGHTPKADDGAGFLLPDDTKDLKPQSHPSEPKKYTPPAKKR